jgi:uridine kinase
MNRTPRDVAQPVIDHLEAQLTQSTEPIFVAIDGRSGVGKSTIAAEIANWFRSRHEPAQATLIEGDDFYGGGSQQTWEQRTTKEQAAEAFDWRRQLDLLLRLRRRENASVDPFDWGSPDWDQDGIPLSGNTYSVAPAPLVILEGVYSGRPELQDVFDLRVLVDTDTELQRRQLEDREGEHMNTDWETRWAAAEDYYFEHEALRGEFDLVIKVR